MFKTDFYIFTENENTAYKKVSGWGETLEAPDGSIIEIRLYKHLKQWLVAEESTGHPVTLKSFTTRAAAIESLTPEVLQRVAERLKEPAGVKAANRLADYIIIQNLANYILTH